MEMAAPVQVLNNTVNTWKTIWKAKEAPPPHGLSFPEQPNEDLPAISVSDITKIRSKFKTNTSVPDRWHPAHFARMLHDHDHQRFATMLTLIEAAKRMPPQCKTMHG